MTSVSLEFAIDLLELTNEDVVQLTEDKLKAKAKAARGKWHPDRVANLDNSEQSALYTKKFQSIEPSVDLIRKHIIEGGSRSSDFIKEERQSSKSNVQIIRENADHMLDTLRACWPDVIAKNFMLDIKKEVLHPGSRIADLVDDDLKTNIAYLAILSFLSFTSIWGVVVLMLLIFSPVMGLIGFIFWVLMALFNFVGVLPISRHWLPKKLELVMYWFIEFGISIYNFCARSFSGSTMVTLYLSLLRFVASLLKYVIVIPIYGLVSVLFGKRVIGKVESISHTYASVYKGEIERILSAEVVDMSEDDLFTLSYLYSNLIDVRQEV
jgi:hypothetical protein